MIPLMLPAKWWQEEADYNKVFRTRVPTDSTEKFGVFG